MGLNITFWNCQGVRSKRKELELYLTENSIDIIALNEAPGRKEFGIFARRAMVDQAREGTSATSEKLNILVYLTLKRSSVLS